MKNRFLNWIGIPPASKEKQNESVKNDVVYMGSSYGAGAIYSDPIGVSFDGEKTPGELGDVVEVIPDYHRLRLRAYESNLKYDVIKIITGKFFKWTIGNGLKLQSEPKEDYLEKFGIKNDWQKLRKELEDSFNLFTGLKNCDYSGMKNFHQLANDCYNDSFLGGDSLVIFRIENGYPNVQIIDGQEVSSPMLFSDFYTIAENAGNRIKNGVEIDSRGRHVAFYVRSEEIPGVYKHKRIPAKIEGFSFVMAKMVYFDKHRMNHTRGVSALSAILEKVDKLDRYTEATVGSAEERVKLAYTIEHDSTSTGENPMLDLKKKLGKSIGDESGIAGAAELGEKLARNIARTTDKTIVNMPVGSKLTTPTSITTDINYDAFFNAIFNQVCSSMDMPPEIALQKFDSNYSASRAAIKSWEYMIKIAREKFSIEFYRPFFELFFYCEVLKGNIKCEGFILSEQKNDFMKFAAFTNSIFEGVNMPHIDPVKEVKAVRELLGKKYEDTPLISLDQATEQLNQGDWESNYKSVTEETEKYNLVKEDNESISKESVSK